MRMRIAHRRAKSHFVLRIVDREFEHPQREGVALRDPPRQRQRLLLQIGPRHHQIDQFDSQRLLRVDKPALEQNFLRLADAHVPRRRKILCQRRQKHRIVRRDD